MITSLGKVGFSVLLLPNSIPFKGITDGDDK